MPQLQTSWLISLFILALLAIACQPAIEPDRLPPQETAISQVVTSPSPTSSSTPIHVSSPTVTPSPTATPTLAHTSQGDQLPTRSPTSAPTSTAIPAEKPVPSTIATRPLSTPTTAPVTEVDLPTLEESLVLLDRLDRRQGKPTPSPVKPIIYEGGVVSVDYSGWGHLSCPECEPDRLNAEIYMGVNGTITGKFWSVFYDSDDGIIPLSGTVNSVTGIFIYQHEDGTESTFKLQAKLVDNGRKFEGTYVQSLLKGDERLVAITNFSLGRK